MRSDAMLILGILMLNRKMQEENKKPRTRTKERHCKDWGQIVAEETSFREMRRLFACIRNCDVERVPSQEFSGICGFEARVEKTVARAQRLVVSCCRQNDFSSGSLTHENLRDTSELGFG